MVVFGLEIGFKVTDLGFQLISSEVLGFQLVRNGFVGVRLDQSTLLGCSLVLIWFVSITANY